MAKSNKTVVVFHSNDCPACKDYLPRFRRVAVKYRPFVEIKHVTLGPKTEKTFDEYKIRALPTTVILDANQKIVKKVAGSVEVGVIGKIFEAATKN
jgi:thiol-disulfide isomerase/thioredoxin